MKRLVITLIIMISCTFLFAATYEIIDYEFLIEGKTNANSLNEVVGNVGQSFDSLSSLETFLEEKKQTLINLRLFSDVNYTYAIANRVPDLYEVQVTFFIHDASSVFVLPYPKFDSNYGFKLGIKAYDKNLRGNLTNLYAYIGFQQQENLVKKGLGSWELSLSDIKIKDFKMAAKTFGELDLLTWDNSYAGASLSVSEIKFKNLELSGLAGFKFQPDGSTTNSPWAFSTVNLAASMAFLNNRFENMALSGEVDFHLLEMKVDSSVNMSYHMGYDIYHQVEIASVQSTDPFDVDGKDYIKVGVGAKRYVPFTENFGFTNRLMFYFTYNFDSRKVVTPNFDYTISSSLSDIDWVGNFRKGFSYSLRLDLLSYPLYKTERNSFKLWGEISSYIYISKFFNLSSRLSLTMSDREQPFALLEDYNIADYLRGIRLDNDYIYNNLEKENYPRRVFMIFNLDLMTKFIELKNFCKSYIIPFTDIALIKIDQVDKEFKWLSTVGIEGIAILDSHPSYPIRGSLGINAEDLINYAKGQIKFSEIEYEIYIGMGMFY